MSTDSSNYTPTVFFYIGNNDDDEDEDFVRKTLSAFCITKSIQFWHEVSTWKDECKPPLELAIKVLRILQGIRSSPRERKQMVGSYNAALNRRTSKVSAALQEYKELLCTQVFSALEETEGLEFSELKEEIKQMKAEIEHEKTLSYQKNYQVHKRSIFSYIKGAFIKPNHLNSNLDWETDELLITSREQPDTKASNNEEEEDDKCTVKCFRRFNCRK